MSWTPPSHEVAQWAAESVNAATASWSRRLSGGTHALTDVIEAGGEELVLRRFPRGDDAVHRESRVLGVLAGLAGLAPRLLAADPDGVRTGTPTILTSLLPGHACITPDDWHSYVTQFAQRLAYLHQHGPTAGLPEVMKPPPDSDGPGAVAVREDWSRLRSARFVLTHYDYWSGNTVWRDGQLTGIVDWSGAGLAPAGFDVSWARLDLVILHSPAMADAFTSCYQASTGSRIRDLDLWDRYAAANADAGIEDWAPNYLDLGRDDLGPHALRHRLSNWMRLIGFVT
jgi:aminoglycoside phosphotransferase (APT) family kinase protein